MHRFCFSLALGLTAAAWLSAADGSRAPDTQTVRKTSVVRSDPRTGKLVRSVVVNARPVAEKKVAETVVAARTIPPAKPPAPAPAATPGSLRTEPGANINQLVAEAAARESLPPELIHSVIKVESDYNPYAVSPKGAQGLMQLIPETAQRFGVSNAFSPADNIGGGARYLRYLLELYKGDYTRALAAYNAGEGAVARYGGVPPYEETRNYLVRVGKQLEKSVSGPAQHTTAGQNQSMKETQPESKADAGKGDGMTHLQEIVQPDGTVRYVSK